MVLPLAKGELEGVINKGVGTFKRPPPPPYKGISRQELFTDFATHHTRPPTSITANKTRVLRIGAPSKHRCALPLPESCHNKQVILIRVSSNGGGEPRRVSGVVFHRLVRLVQSFVRFRLLS